MGQRRFKSPRPGFPGTYADVQNAWQSTCPLNCAWEDAVSDDLVAPGPDGFLALTEMGRGRLNGAAPPQPA